MASNYSYRPRRVSRFRLALLLGGAGAFGLFLFTFLLWRSFFVYVPPGFHLVVTAKGGAPLPEGEVLAERGQKGVQKEVLGEGWQFVMPFQYTSELGRNTVIKAGDVGVLKALGGKPLPPNAVLAEPGPDGGIAYQGIQRQVLLPGSYRINLRGFEVEPIRMTKIEPGFVGVLRRILGKDGEEGRFARGTDEKGILKEVLQPGLYPLNTYEFHVQRMEVGIYQTTFHYSPDPAQNTAITFTAQGTPISMDCTIEWEILPEDQPSLAMWYKSQQKVDEMVIRPQAAAVGINKGGNYNVKQLLDGTGRERFQNEFRDGLIAACTPEGRKGTKVAIHSAFIRNIVIPEIYLEPIRQKQVAAETVLTNQAKQETAKTLRDLEQEQEQIVQEVAKVEATTQRMVATIERDAENVKSKTLAELEKLDAEYQSKIATLVAEQKRLLGEAEAQATQLKEIARSSLYKMKMDVFQNDANAFLRYTLAEKLNPNVSVRLVHTGPGTFWTNMDGKGLQFQIPAPGGAPAKPVVPAARK